MKTTEISVTKMSTYAVSVNQYYIERDNLKKYASKIGFNYMTA